MTSSIVVVSTSAHADTQFSIKVCTLDPDNEYVVFNISSTSTVGDLKLLIKQYIGYNFRSQHIFNENDGKLLNTIQLVQNNELVYKEVTLIIS